MSSRLPSENSGLQIRLALLRVTEEHEVAPEGAAKLFSQLALELTDVTVASNRDLLGDSEGQDTVIRSELLSVMEDFGFDHTITATYLRQCAAMIHDDFVVMKIAEQSDLQLKDYDPDEALELYYNIWRGRQNLGYVSKGWSDPGFRLGNLLLIPVIKVSMLRKCSRQIASLCANNGITVTVREDRIPIELQLGSVIYEEGFNQKTFLKVLGTLNECAESISRLLDS
ncbi:MAG: hypothetical protein NTY53_01460 [Kiritimatiellaeota bacterium]|nr:hypothetical protein [Kiritimatiellota bacterium]